MADAPDSVAEPRAEVDFTPEDVERARRYHRPIYRSLVLDLGLGLGSLSALAFTPAGDALFAPVRGLAWWAAAPAFGALTVGVLAVVRSPLAFWRGFLHEHRWGFSTQGVPAWVLDRAKGMAVGAALTSGILTAFVGLARWRPESWPAAAAPALAGFVLVLSFVGPVILEPIFLRFRPIEDQALAGELHSLAERAGVPIRDVLVADASRRTRKENAYVSGLGRTRRVVIFDTLLGRNDSPGVRLIVAHELGHRRQRHVAKGTLLGMIAAAGAVLALGVLLRDHALLRAARSSGAADPRAIPLVLLAGAVLQLLAAPFESALSRRWESAADRFSLELTGDVDAFVESFRALARSNLIHLDPPRALYLWTFSHPTPPERIAAARRLARRSAGRPAS